MKLSSLHLDAFVPVPGFSSVDGHPKLEREKDFSEASGWDIRETTTGVFAVQHTSMDKPVTIGGYGYSFASSDSAPAEGQSDGSKGDASSATIPKKRGKR